MSKEEIRDEGNNRKELNGMRRKSRERRGSREGRKKQVNKYGKQEAGRKIRIIKEKRQEVLKGEERK